MSRRDSRSTLTIVADMLVAAMPLRDRPVHEVRKALKLLVKSNPELVYYVCYTLGSIKEDDE